jgi:hypothetical protein
MPKQNWVRFLLVLSAFGVIFGVVLAFTPLLSPVGGIYYDYYVGDGAYLGLSTAELDYQRLLYGVMGALMASWFVIVGYVVHEPFRRGEQWAWNAILLSTLMWFLGDGYVSIITGFAIHAALNLSLLIPIMIALMATRGDMTTVS